MTASSSLSSSSPLSRPLFILYGSATGNAEHIAKDLAAACESQLSKTIDDNAAAAAGSTVFSSVICCELDQFKKKCLPIWETAPTLSSSSDASSSSTTITTTTTTSTTESLKHGVLIVTSTTGNGDAPENASRFVRFIKRKTTPVTTFQHVAFAVLALGDTNYDQFCQCGKTIDKRLEELGGTRIQPVACADEATGLEDVVEPWTATILQNITAACGAGPNALTTLKTTTLRHTNGVSKTHDGAVNNKDGSVENTNNKDASSTTATQAATTSAAPLDAGTTLSSAEPSLSSESSLGVSTIRSLLNLQPSDTLPSVDPSLLPSLTTSLSSCELLVSNNHENTTEDDPEQPLQQRARGLSLADSHSTASSGFHYTLHKPFASTILQARYLTRQTSLAAAQQIHDEWIQSLSSYTDDDSPLLSPDTLERATSILETHFPLSSSTSSTNGNHEDSIIERNSKRVLELTLSLPDDYTLEYAPGDSLGLIVENPPSAARFILNMIQEKHGISADQMLSIDSNHPITVEEAVRKRIDLSSPIKNKRLLSSLAWHATDASDQAVLQLLASKLPIGCDLFDTYIDQQRRTVVDILREFPSCQNIPLEALLSILPSIPPRYYSVSSSPLEHQRVSLTIAFSVVDYLTPSLEVNGTERGLRRIHGVATGHLEALCSSLLCASSSDLTAANQPTVGIFPKPSAEFRMPSTLATPLILIGPGTGVAPFMGFLSHRRAMLTSSESTEAAHTVVEGTWRGGYEMEENELPVNEQDASGLNLGVEFRTKQGVGSVDLFFGCRHQDHDWLYREEMETFHKQGIVSNLYTAFSRDGTKRQYVQDIMKGDESTANRVRELIIREGACVYLCGDGNSMAKDVQSAIVDLLCSEKGDDVERASNYLEEMKKSKRFVMDIWS